MTGRARGGRYGRPACFPNAPDVQRFRLSSNDNSVIITRGTADGGTCRKAAGDFPSTAGRLRCFYLVPSVGTTCRFWKLLARAGDLVGGFRDYSLPASAATGNGWGLPYLPSE